MHMYGVTHVQRDGGDEEVPSNDNNTVKKKNMIKKLFFMSRYYRNFLHMFGKGYEMISLWLEEEASELLTR